MNITLKITIYDQGKLRDGKIAAIKVLSAESRQGLREFLTEINVISVIEHENLVQLYGCCVDDNHRILVYNYLENNSLAQTLLGTNRILFLILFPLYNVFLFNFSLNGCQSCILECSPPFGTVCFHLHCEGR